MQLTQIKFRFDKLTVQKIIKGAFWAVIPSSAIALLEYISTLEINNVLLASLVVWAVPTLVNIIREWSRGK